MSTTTQDLTAEGGKTTRFIVRCTSKGEIKKCILRQIDGDLDGFTYALYSAAEACPPGITDNGDEPTVDAVLAEDHLIGQEFVVADTKDRYLEDDKPVTAFENGEYTNRDNGGSQTNRLRQIYLMLTVAGTGVKHFHIHLDIETKSNVS